VLHLVEHIVDVALAELCKSVSDGLLLFCGYFGQVRNQQIISRVFNRKLQYSVSEINPAEDLKRQAGYA